VLQVVAPIGLTFDFFGDPFLSKSLLWVLAARRIIFCNVYLFGKYFPFVAHQLDQCYGDYFCIKSCQFFFSIILQNAL